MTEDAPGAKRLLILGTGAIARTHAEKFALIPGCELVAAADMNAERARDFAAAHAIPNAFGSLTEAIAWGEFDAAVNSTPDAAHHPTTLELIAAGKPVFCEKPLALDHAAALEPRPRAVGIRLTHVSETPSNGRPAASKARRTPRATTLSGPGGSEPAPSPSTRTDTPSASAASTSLCRPRASPSASKPGPRFADVAGTRTWTRMRSVRAAAGATPG